MCPRPPPPPPPLLPRRPYCPATVLMPRSGATGGSVLCFASHGMHHVPAHGLAGSRDCVSGVGGVGFVGDVGAVGDVGGQTPTNNCQERRAPARADTWVCQRCIATPVPFLPLSHPILRHNSFQRSSW